MFDPGLGDFLNEEATVSKVSSALSRPGSGWSSMLSSPSQYMPSHQNISSWLESGRALTTRVQEMVSPGRPVALAGSASDSLVPRHHSLDLVPQHGEGGQHQIMEGVVAAFERQEHINRAHAQLSKVNYMVNVANYMKHKQVEKVVAEGQRELCRINDRMKHQTHVIENLNQSVEHLDAEVEHQKHVSERLSTSLDAQQKLLDTTILESREAIERQNSILAKQEAVVKKLLHQKLRHDFIVDGTVVLVCLYLSNTFLVKFPLQIILQVVPQHKSRKWLHQMFRLALVLELIRILKSWSVKVGLHNSVGSTMPYLQTGVQLAWTRVQNIPALTRYLVNLIRGQNANDETEVKRTTNTPLDAL